jgi:hypothetical protein
MDNKQKGNLAIASAIKHKFLPSTGDNCSPVEESTGDNFPNSAKPLEDDNAEPIPDKIGAGVET